MCLLPSPLNPIITYLFHANMENQKCISYGLERETGVSLSHCYQCGKCSAGCVLAEEMDFPPSYLVHLLQTKTPANDNRVLSSNAIWICLNCENCIARCPKEVDIPAMMDYLREHARLKGCINKQAQPIVDFHRSFLQSVKHTGRLYEIGLVAGFKARTLRLFQDVKLVPSMLQKGKLNLLPESVKDKQKIKKIFAQTIENPKEKKV